MNVIYVFQGITFEWDSHKASSNLNKHNVSFEVACEIFFDPFVSDIDGEYEYINGELRERVAGMLSNWQLLCVVYIMRKNKVRLISARRATNAERRYYENG